MKINAITKTNFTGLFTDKTHQNNGNWRMEYSPYSWEKNNTSKMANQVDLDLKSYTLPDNEKIFAYGCDGKKSCKDIFGTEFYYEYPNGAMRKTITEMPAMNREESLNVQTKKLKTFVDMKYGEMNNRLEWNIKNSQKLFDLNKKSFMDASEEYDLGFFDRTHSKKDLKNNMKRSFDDIYSCGKTLLYNAMDYIELSKSKDIIVDKIAENEKEIKLLKDARLKDNLIDISKRDVYDPNKALWIAMHNAKAIINKIVALPDRTITVEQILKAIGNNIKDAEIPQKAVQYVDALIKKAI